MEQPNLNYINALAGEDLAFKSKLLAIIKTELPKEINVYKQFILSEQFFEAAEVVHKLKNKISMLGLEKAYKLAQDYEEALRKNELGLKEEFQSITHNMLAFIKSI